MPARLLDKLIYTAKKIALRLKEKQKMTIDDHILEHMLFYHDLSGANLENNKESRIVKADIKEALSRKNNSELGLALKLSPTFWSEHIKSIIGELNEDEKQTISQLLLAAGKNTQQAEESSLILENADWRVRANAAHIFAFLDTKEAAPALINALNDDTKPGIMSFCYIAYALGKIKGKKAQEALQKQLTNTDPWLRVDAAGALAHFAFSDVVNPLAKALIYEQEALDYMSYAISKQIKPRNFLTTSNKEAVQAGARLIFGIIEASENSFTINLIFETESHLCLPLLVELAQKQMEPVLIDTAFNLCGWFSDTRNNISADEIDSLNVHLLESEEQEAALRQMANDQSLKTKILKIIESANDLNKDPQLIHALRLAGKLDIAQAHPVLIDLLTDQNSTLSLNELKHVIIAISLLSVDEEKTVATLINFANRLVNVQERQALSKQKQPVAEENAKEVKTYWEILRAMGNLFTNSSAIFLVNALNDYAPDMRWCALESIVEIYDKNKQVNLPKSIEDILQTALKDPSPMVQLAALLGATKLNRANLIKDIISLINAQENTVSKQALTSLSYMAQNGHGVDVKTALNEKIKTVKEEHKKQRIIDILQKY